MSTSQTAQFLSDLSGDGPISEERLLYLEQRALGQFYDYVLSRFEAEQARTGLTKAKLARRTRKGQDQINRWLASPGNWTIGTVARLLAGIASEEPILTSAALLGRPPRNMSVMDLLEEDDAQIQIQIPSDVITTGSSSPSYVIQLSGPH